MKPPSSGPTAAAIALAFALIVYASYDLLTLPRL